LNIVQRAAYRIIKALALTDEKAWDRSLWNLRTAQSLSGEQVDEYTALHYSAIFNAVSLISGTVAALPLHLIRRRGKSTIHADNLPLYHVLHSKANPYMTAMALRESMMSHILLWGNAYCEIVRDNKGDILELWPITPNRVKVEMNNGQIIYRIKMDRDGDVYLPRTRVLHVPGLGFDGFMGYSVVSMARKSIGLGMAMETFGALYFGNGTHPGVVVSHPGKLTEEASKRLSGSLTEGYAGLGKSHRLLLLEEGMKIEKIGIPPEDSQFLESRQFQIPEVARWFNLPPHKLKDLTKSSFSNIESEQISFVTDAILPWLIRLEQNYAMQLLTDGELKQRLYFKHIVEGLLRGSSTDRAEFYRKLWHLGAMSINEIREKEDMDPIDNGDEHFVPMNMVPLSKIDEFMDKRQEGSNEPKPGVPEEDRDSGTLNKEEQVFVLIRGKEPEIRPKKASK